MSYNLSDSTKIELLEMGTIALTKRVDNLEIKISALYMKQKQVSVKPEVSAKTAGIKIGDKVHLLNEPDFANESVEIVSITRNRKTKIIEYSIEDNSGMWFDGFTEENFYKVQ